MSPVEPELRRDGKYHRRHINHAPVDIEYCWAAVGVIAALIGLGIFLAVEPSEAEARNGYDTSCERTPIEVSAKSFCDQIEKDWAGKERPESIRKVCGV